MDLLPPSQRRFSQPEQGVPSSPSRFGAPGELLPAARLLGEQDLDGPLVDYAAKGTKIELADVEKVEDRATYKLKLTMKSGEAIHIWIDAQTFLETKMEGQPRRLDGIYHPVEIYYRDYC